MKSFPFLQYFLIGALFAVCLGFLSMQYVFAETITFSQEGQSISEEKLIYTESELFDLMTPASVKILQHVEGTVTIPSFVIDPENKTVVVDAVKEPTVLENISEDLLGTGFFVSPDGYIITSSYAVSLTASKLVIIDSFIQRAISEAVDGENVEEVIDELFTKEIVDFMLQEISFDLQMSIIVLGFEEDTEEEDEVFNIYDLGFVAEVLFVNDNFYKEGQDVALLKITGEDHPSASLSERENIDLGEKVYLFRSPTTAIIESVNSLVKEDIYNMSLTSGIVVRENTIASSSIYELDLAVSTDLGGSPVFDAAGDILGIALYDASSGFGDSVSMFILPTNSINTLLSLTSTTASASVFHTRIREGLLFAKELKCEETYSSFAVAFGSPSVFVDRSVFDKYIEGCNEMLAIDQKQNGGFSGILNTFQQKVASMSVVHWILVVAGFFLIFFVILWIVSRKGSKETKGYTNETPVRSETIKTARRAPLSDRMPVLHDKDKPKKSEMTIPQKEKLQEKLPDGIKRADLETEEEVKRTDENRILQEKKKDDDFHVVTAKFPRKTSLPDDVGDIPQKTAKGVSDVISGNDEERLAALWPNKYSKKDKDKKETIAYSAVSLYIKQTRRLGFKDDEIKKELLEAGWKSEDVDNGFKATT